MRKAQLILIIAMLLITACSEAAAPTFEPTETAVPTPTGTATPAPPAATSTPEPTATTTRQPASDTPTPKLTESGGVPVGFTDDGAPYRGNPDAPVTMLEFSEYL